MLAQLGVFTGVRGVVILGGFEFHSNDIFAASTQLGLCWEWSGNSGGGAGVVVMLGCFHSDPLFVASTQLGLVSSLLGVEVKKTGITTILTGRHSLNHLGLLQVSNTHFLSKTAVLSIIASAGSMGPVTGG